MVFFCESLQNKRSRNEDSCCHMDVKMNHEATVSAFAVADGMGGLDAGNLYADTAVSLWFQNLVRTLMSEEFRDRSLETQIDALKHFSGEAMEKVNQHLYKKGLDAGLRGGTTLTTAIYFWDTWIFANCGDSPIYVMSEGKLKRVSEIQNMAWQLVKEGKTQVGSTLFLQNRNRLLEYLGRRQEIHPHVTCVEENKIESILMGSDGAFGNLTSAVIEKVLKKREDRSGILPRILEMSRDQGEKDNQTAFLIFPPARVTPEPEPADSAAIKGIEGRDFVSMYYSLNEVEEPAELRSLEEMPIRNRLRRFFSGRREEP